MHDKKSIYFSDLKLLLQLHKVHNLCKTSTEFTATVQDFIVCTVDVIDLLKFLLAWFE